MGASGGRSAGVGVTSRSGAAPPSANTGLPSAGLAARAHAQAQAQAQQVAVTPASTEMLRSELGEGDRDDGDFNGEDYEGDAYSQPTRTSKGNRSYSTLTATQGGTASGTYSGIGRYQPAPTFGLEGSNFLGDGGLGPTVGGDLGGGGAATSKLERARQRALMAKNMSEGGRVDPAASGNMGMSSKLWE